MKTKEIENGVLFNEAIIREVDGTLWEIKAFKVRNVRSGAVDLHHLFRKLRDNGLKRRHRAIRRAHMQRMVRLRKRHEQK